MTPPLSYSIEHSSQYLFWTSLDRFPPVFSESTLSQVQLWPHRDRCFRPLESFMRPALAAPSSYKSYSSMPTTTDNSLDP
ncbi:hypothetical protein NXS19_000225 [Fusarium pseudograminearum]|nr:hypothetical protein NXS19_000225 [Fusarium pseudograminearum]